MINGLQYITIASDISMHTESNISTWAVYIRGDFGAVKRSGRFINPSGSTWLLEMQATCNAIHIASKYVDLSKCKLLIYSEVDQLFTFKYKKDQNGNETDQPYMKSKIRHDFFIAYVKPLLDLADSYEIRKVKAHMPPRRIKKMKEGQKRYYMNRWCDIESRRLMKELRRINKNEQKT